MNNPINKLHNTLKNIVMAGFVILLVYLSGSWLLGREFSTIDKIIWVGFATVATVQWLLGLMNLGISIVQEGFQPKWQIEHFIWTSIAVGCLHGGDNITPPENLSRFAILFGMLLLCFALIALAIWRMKMTNPNQVTTA